MANDQTKKVNLDIRRYVFPREPIATYSRLTQEMLEDLKRVHRDGPLRTAQVYSEPDYLMRGLLVAMRSYLLSSNTKKTETLSVRTPATWWDHFKHDMLLSADHPILRRIVSHFEPPAYKYESKEVVTETRFCPHDDTYFREDEKHATWLSWSFEDEPSVKIRD